MDDVGAKLGMCGLSWELPVMSLAQAGHPVRVFPSPSRVLRLGQQGLIHPSMASLCFQNRAAQPGVAQAPLGLLGW